mmetsp:Transcript_12618/g.18128  ORF Transcript_12618/g.18128 Transcript_12618/m.18128 type:complete len:120 (+) Transcript_12618:460-819(+)
MRTYQKLQDTRTAGLQAKFELIQQVNEDANMKQLEAVYSVSIRVTQLKEFFKKCDMADIFVIASDYFQNPQQNGDLIPTDNAGTIDLFTEYSKVSIDLVKQASEFIMFRGEEKCKLVQG